MKISLVSLDQQWEDKARNLQLCEEYILSASKDGVDLIIFPEMTLTGFSFNISEISEERDYSNTVNSFEMLAKKYSISIICGVVFKEGNKATNNCIYISSKGVLEKVYTKIHPFTFAGEDKYYVAGSALSKIDTTNAKIGITICYDLRFPELYSSLSSDCDIIVNIANWPQKRVEHWNTLLKARAIENQTIIIGVNRVGFDGNSLQYEKSSAIFDANGDKINHIKEFNDMDVFEIDIRKTGKFQNSFNTFRDRKTELYKEIL